MLLIHKFNMHAGGGKQDLAAKAHSSKIRHNLRINVVRA